MKKSIKTIGTVAALGTMLVCAYLFGAAQAKTIIVEKEIEKRVEVAPDGYMPLNECIPLEDVSCCFINDYDCLCFELKDVAHQKGYEFCGS